MRFDSVVFADTARLAVLSCFARLKAERAAGRRTLVIPLVDAQGAEVIRDWDLASVITADDVEPLAEGAQRHQPWRERIAVMVRRLDPRHVIAPLGLLGAPQEIDYFDTLRSALSMDRGRDLLFFEERPYCLLKEALALRLAAKGVRLPPASDLRLPGRYATFVLRMSLGIGVPPVFGGIAERTRRSRALKSAFGEAADWDPHRALGPKVQPVIEPSSEGEVEELFRLASELGQEDSLGSPKSFKRRMTRHARSAGSRTPVERYWLSLPGAVDADSGGEPL